VTVSTAYATARDALSAGGWGGWMSDPAAIPPPSVYTRLSLGLSSMSEPSCRSWTVAACMRVIGDSISGLPVKVKRHRKRKRFTTPRSSCRKSLWNPLPDIDREQGRTFNCITSWGLNGCPYYHIIPYRTSLETHFRWRLVNSVPQMRVNMIKGHRVYRMDLIQVDHSKVRI